MIDFSLTCSDASAALWGLFDFSIAPALLFYAYIPIILVALGLGIYVLIQTRFSLGSKLLFLLATTFGLLLLNEIITWIAAPVSLVMFSWELVVLFRIIVPIITFYFVYVFINGKDMPFLLKLILSIPYVTVIFLSPTTANIEVFDLYNCEAIPGYLWHLTHFFGLIIAVWIGFITIKKFFDKLISAQQRQSGLFVGVGATFFLLIFISASVWGDVTQIYDVAIVGPIGMLLFVITLTYSMVQYKAFNIKLAAPVSLVFGLFTLVFSLLFVRDIEIAQTIIIVTLGLLLIFGYFLIKSVRREIAARERNEQLAKDLARANNRLREMDRQKSEFVSIASHQLRSPLAAIRGYASMILEGSYGKLPPKLKAVIERIQESSAFMALSIEDFLDVSRIEQGRMKYEITEVNLAEIAEKIVDELRSVALKRGLTLLYRSDCETTCKVHADPGKIRQIIYNLIDNAIKYTKKGSIKVTLKEDTVARKLYVTVEDTGVGMSEETLRSIFEKFVRAKNANSVNVQGTGLGLYVAKQMIEAMHGKITPTSEGEGKGSKFTVELPSA